jgi:hypothetical protein
VIRRLAGALAVVAAAACVSSAVAATTTSDPAGTVLLDGAKTFPIVLAKGPEPGTTTPDGLAALAEVASGGATYLKTGPATVAWTAADIEDAKEQNRAAAANGLHTWVNLSTVAQATPGSTRDALLEQVVNELESDSGAPAIGMWKGADEPLWSGIAPSALQFSFCRSTGRGTASWCGGEPVLDTDHAWVTIQAPRGTAQQLAQYTPVTDIHGVDVYPVTLTAAAPNLHGVGTWTSTIGSVTPSRAVWTTLQVCASGSYDSSGAFVLPTFAQERYMLYDAILNGARSIAFYGGNNPNCWTATDRQYGWNWTFWSSVLKPLLGEVNSLSPLAPALVNPATTQTLTASDATTQAISRQGNADDLWVIAARHGTGSARVTIGGLPASVSTGTVYTEGRSISVSNGSFEDDFAQWGVHVYHFVPDAPPPPPPPPPAPGGGGGGGSADPVTSPAPAPVVAPPSSPPPAGVKAAQMITRTGTARRDTLRGTNGPDRLLGLGGPDLLYGLGGADTLVGGVGADRLFGGAGNDTVLAGDRARDVIACGPGRDVVRADPGDRVARDCERVIRIRR